MKIHEINLIINQLKPTLINSFVMFYGEGYRDRIENVINSITFAYVSKNNNEYLGSSNDKRIDNSILNRISNISNVDGACLNHTQPPVIVLSIDNGIIIRNLIHEVNHALHNKQVKKTLGIPILDNNAQSDYQEGITNVDFKVDDSLENLTYEIINEYMTKEIFDIFMKINNDKTLNCEYIIYQYTSLDNVCNNIIKNVYLKFKTFIKEKLITADGQKIRDAIGKNNYRELNSNLYNLYREYEKFLIKIKVGNEKMVKNMTLNKEFDLLEKNFFVYLNNNNLLKPLENLETKITISIDRYCISNNIIYDTLIKKGKD